MINDCSGFLVADTRLYTLPCRSVRRSVHPSRNIFELRAVFALLLLPNRPRLDCRVSGLVYYFIAKFLSATEYHSDADYNSRWVGVVVVFVVVVVVVVVFILKNG